MAERTFASRIEIFQRTRRIESVPAGQTLRVLDREPFHLVWTADDWATKNETVAQTVAPLGSFADVATLPTQAGHLRFTLFWPGRNAWLGQDFAVAVIAAKTQSAAKAAPPVAVKPSN